MSSHKYPNGAPKAVIAARVAISVVFLLVLFTQAPALVSAASTLAVLIGIILAVACVGGIYLVLVEGKLDVKITNILEKGGLL